MLFQAVSTLREATLREWSLLSQNLVTELQNFLLTYIVNSVEHNGSDKYVQRQILQTLAVFYKRSKLDSMKVRAVPVDVPATSNMVKDVIELFKSSGIKMVYLFKASGLPEIIY